MKHLLVATLGAVFVLGLATSPAAADDPIVSRSSALNPIPADYVPLTPEQAVIAAAKDAHKAQSAAWFAAHPPSTGPEPMCPCGDPGPYPYQATAGTVAHQQETDIYCGPASTQTVELYTRGIQDSQPDIAAYQHTDIDGSTYVWRERDGLNHFVALPANFVYLYVQPVDGDDWYLMVQEDIGYYGMPQVASTAPHDPGALHWLPSWPNAITAGHYVVVNGYVSNSYSTGSVSYNDSSGGFGGGTGTYSTSTGVMWYTITKGNAQHDPGWVIW